MVRQPGDGYRQPISCISSVKGNLRWLLPYKSFSLSLDFSLPLYFKATSDTREIPQGSHWERMVNTATRVNFSSTSGAPASELAV